MSSEMIIEELSQSFSDLELVKLVDLLIEVVEEGASIGFLPPLEQAVAKEYWENVWQPGVILFVAKLEQRIVGSVQLHLSTKQNGTHLAEIAKLMVHPQMRRKSVGRMLMEIAEKRAKEEGRSLLVLDTREGDPSNLLYQSIGYVEAGKIPFYARSANGELDTTVIYYKQLST